MYEALIAQAFQQAYDYKRQTYPNLDMWDYISEHIYQYGNDRRYKLHLLAASTSFRSALVKYHGISYYVDHDYPTNTYSVTRRIR